jgi:hypothetical protein
VSSFQPSEEIKSYQINDPKELRRAESKSEDG